MATFQDSLAVEQAGINSLKLYATRRWAGASVSWHTGRVAQQTGDFTVSRNGATIATVEAKIEARHTGRLFLETWSNYGHRRGWAYTCQADHLWYCFLDRMVLYAMPVAALRQFVANDLGPLLASDPFTNEVRQSKYDQRNDTRGVPVSVAILRRLVPGFAGPVDVSPVAIQQGGLFDLEP